MLRKRAVRLESCQKLLLCCLLLAGFSACGPRRPTVPDGVEAIAHRCYETLATPGRTPQLEPSSSMEDGTFLILWSIAEFPDERGSCTVDGNGAVLLLTSNVDGLQTESTPSP